MGKLKNFDIVVIGRSCLDYIAIVDRFARENQKVPLSFRLTEGGGQGAGNRPGVQRLAWCNVRHVSWRQYRVEAWA